jgi:GT2 family glycosyltransferase
VRLVNPDGSSQKFRTSFGINLWPQRLNRVSPITFFGTTFHMGRRALYNAAQVGPFDENYYFFNEDLDWSVRAHRKRLVFHYVPSMPVVHYGGLGRGQNRRKILRELYAANLYFYAKFYGRSLTRVIYLIHKTELLGRLAYFRLAGRQNSNDAVAYRLALVKVRRFMERLRYV